MGSFIPAAPKQWLDAWLAAETIFLSFHDGDPGTTGANEYTSAGIGRVTIEPLTTTETASGATGTNSAIVQSAAATGATAEITHLGLFDAATGGDFLGSHKLSPPVTLATGERLSWPIGELSVRMPA